MVSSNKRKRVKESDGAHTKPAIMSVEKASKMIDKNSKSMAKLLHLQEVLVTVRNTEQSGCSRHLEVRIEKIKSRVGRRLRHLARWADTPATKRLPAPAPAARASTRSLQKSRGDVQTGTVFVRDHNVQRGAILPERTNPSGGKAGFPFSLNIARKPEESFRPGSTTVFQHADEVVSRQKQVLLQAMSGITKSHASSRKEVTLIGTQNAINVELPKRPVT